MSTILSTVLVASPPAFLAGWLLSKVLLRQTRPTPGAVANAQQTLSSTVAPDQQATAAVAIDAAAVAETAPNTAAKDQRLITQLRQQVAAARSDLQPMQADIQLLREAAAEREQLVRDLQQKLQLQLKTAPPEDSPAVAAATETAKYRNLLRAMKDRLAAHEQRITELTQERELAATKRLRSTRRFLNWRRKVRPLAKQFRQQRTMINELREELRQRDLRHQEQEARFAQQRPVQSAAAHSVAPARPAEAAPIEQVGVAAKPEQSATVAGPGSKNAPGIDTSVHAAKDSAVATRNAVQPPAVVAGPASAESADVPDSDYGEDEREDLQKLRGIGPALHSRLNEKGIYRLRQLAFMDAQELLRLGESLGVGKKTMVKQDWAGQARALLQMPELTRANSPASAQPGQSTVAEASNSEPAQRPDSQSA